MIGRTQIINLLMGLWGLNRQILADSIGYKGDSYDDYTDEELLELLKIQERMDDDLTLI